MIGVGDRSAELLLRAPVRFRLLRNVPILGGWIHRLSQRLIPPDRRVWTCVRYGPAKGIWLELNPRTGQDYACGRVEPAVQRVLVELLRPGMVFYDLGANIGFFSLLGARLVKESGKVFSFEPDHEVSDRLRRNMEKNGFRNVYVEEAGMGAFSGSANFLPAGERSPDRGVGHFISNGGADSSELRRCYALDDFVQNSPPPNAIKCDVEGSELEVFSGAKHTLESRRPWVVFEFHSAANGNALRNLCQSIGYTLREVDENHLLAVP